MTTHGKDGHTHKYGAPTGALLDRAPLHIPTQKFASHVREETNEHGNPVLRGLRVFRTGSFTDMFGQEHTWDETHLELMVLHFKLLRESGLFKDVPVRVDHTFSLQNVVGYYEDLYRDPEDPQFLSADIEFTEPEAYQKWQRRTWRARSIEIGMYETNDNRSYYPTVLGLAFVDIPAVEGLHGRSQDKLKFSQAIMDNEETQSMNVPDPSTDPEGWTKAVVYAAWVEAANYAKALDDWTKAVVYAKALEDEAAAQNPPAGVPPVAPFGGTPPTPPAPPSPPPTPPPPSAMAFRVNGTPTADFRTVQAHIDVLEQFRKETADSYRREFVEGLAKDNKISAAQIPLLSSHALSLTDDQFANFRASYEAAPSMSLFGQQVDQGQGATDASDGTPANASADDTEVLKGIVAQFRRIGMAEDKIAKTDSFKKLVALGVESAPSN